MRAMVLRKIGSPLVLEERPLPVYNENEVLIRVEACGVCRTDLHIVQGELPSGPLPIIPGHQIVGTVSAKGRNVQLDEGVRVGVAWLASTCGKCEYCLRQQENLCNNAVFTGYTKDGGFAEYCTADTRYIYPLPASFSSLEASPLLCAGFIGYRALRMTGDAKRIGLYGFGSSAHLIAQVLAFQKREFVAFTKTSDREKERFAFSLGATESGPFTMKVAPLDAAIIFAPEGALIPHALRAVKKGGIVVCAGIHMSDIPSFPYHILWEERVLRSVTNLTRADGREFLPLAAQIPIQTQIHVYPLEKANEALRTLHEGGQTGSLVLSI